MPMNQPKINRTGIVRTAAINNTIILIFSIGITNDIINKINVNPAKTPRKYKKYPLKVTLSMRSNIIMNNNQEIMKTITIINKTVFLDKSFSPEINLILKNLEDLCI